MVILVTDRPIFAVSRHAKTSRALANAPSEVTSIESHNVSLVSRGFEVC